FGSLQKQRKQVKQQDQLRRAPTEFAYPFSEIALPDRVVGSFSADARAPGSPTGKKKRVDEPPSRGTAPTVSDRRFRVWETFHVGRIDRRRSADSAARRRASRVAASGRRPRSQRVSGSLSRTTPRARAPSLSIAAPGRHGRR